MVLPVPQSKFEKNRPRGSRVMIRHTYNNQTEITTLYMYLLKSLGVAHGKKNLKTNFRKKEKKTFKKI